MNVSVCIGTFGEPEWEARAREVALPSVEGQDAFEVLIEHEPDGDIASCRNRLAARARGEWLCFLDGDDELHPGYLDAMRRAAPASGKALLTPAVSYTQRRRQRPSRARVWPRVDFRDGNYLVIGTLVQREVFEEVGGFKAWPMYEDYCLWARCWTAGARVVEVPDAIYLANMRIDSRNRGPKRATKLYSHQAIGHSIWPDLYEAPTEEEIERGMLRTGHLRFCG